MAVLAAAFAAAESAADPYVAFLHTILPPPEYDKPYGGKLTKRFLPVAELDKECGGPGKSGCARPAGDTCEIFVAELGGPMTLALRNVVVRHEIGHCNGWPGDHPRPKWEGFRWLRSFPSAMP